MKTFAQGIFSIVAAYCLSMVVGQAQLFDNLRVLGGTRYAVGDPAVTTTNRFGEVLEGPKEIAVADLDGDDVPDLAVSNKDGSVTLRYGDGDGSFGPAEHLRTWVTAPLDLHAFYFTNVYTNVYCDYRPTNFTTTCYTVFMPPVPPAGIITSNVVCFTNYEYGCVGLITNLHTNLVTIEGPIGLRGLALADFTGDGRRDIAVASPGESLIYLFINDGNHVFAGPLPLAGWLGVRDLAAGDFDGDGLTDLAAAGTTNGLVQYRSLGGGAFAIATTVPALRSDPISGSDDSDYEFPQPAYYLKSVRQPGDDRDELVASFAQRGKIWVLRADEDGKLAVTGDIENVSLTALDAAPLLSPATNGAPVDLITAYSRGGNLDIFAATNLPQRFVGRPVDRYYVSGAPRNVRIADLDGDGWNDLVVVAQRADKVITYHNDGGQLTPIAEAFVGRGPREMDLGDFNQDGRLDLAVLNRQSMDVSILITSTNASTLSGFLALDSVYPVDGGVSGLDLRDFNGDGRLDVLQLHRDTSEFSVRITETNGHLSVPTYYAITNGFNPAAQIAVDVNSDGRADMVSANLSGSVTVRLGQADGKFGPEQTFSLPDSANGALFAVVAGDFDGDGHIDLAAGYLDCRISFFRGDGTGRFTFVKTHLFIYEPRSMAVGDFDQDGDLDIAGGSLAGKFAIVENLGNLLTAPYLIIREHAGSGDFGSNLQVVDQNGDGDPDLLFGSAGGFTLYLGGPELTFDLSTITRGNDPGLSGNTFVFADLDGDGDNDLASICASNSCLSIQVFTNDQYITSLTVPVPSTRYLATGDLDGDGFADLIGSGDVLWVALSSRKATNAPPTELLAARAVSGGAIINEVLSSNTSLPLSADGNRTTDWVEIFNDATQPTSMTGWRLMLVQTNFTTSLSSNASSFSNQLVLVTNSIVVTNIFTFPPDSPLQPSAHRLVICSDRVRSVYHTGFNLPADGGMLCLLNADGNEVSRASYPASEPNFSYARYTDGARRFVVNNIPSPGAPNVDNGAVKPELSLSGVDLDTLFTPGQRLRFRAVATDDVGIMNVSLLWRRLDIPDNVTKRVILYDDGMNEDGPMNDGQFMGVFDEELPDGASIQFYLECTDVTDQVETTPGSPRFVAARQRPQMHSLAIGVARPPLEISEIVTDNISGLTDERGGRADWVEIRNTSSNTVSLAGVTLGPKIFGDGERMTFTNRPSLGPGEHIVIYADGNPSQGQLHAPFRLNRLGEQLALTGTAATGARFVIDAVTYGPQSANSALARLGQGGPWIPGAPTPRAGNVEGLWRSIVDPVNFLLAFPTRAGRTYTVQYRDDLGGAPWVSLPPVRSVGIEQAVQTPLAARRFFRVREE